MPSKCAILMYTVCANARQFLQKYMYTLKTKLKAKNKIKKTNRSLADCNTERNLLLEFYA